MSRTPIAQGQWKAVAGLPREMKKLDPAPSRFQGEKRPVERVSWTDAIEFCARLSRHTGKDYRLPGEARWEYACRGGARTPFHFGPTLSTDIANYNGYYVYGTGRKGIYRGETTEVGLFPPNAFDLCDRHGNVGEWCLDPWHDSYTGAPRDGRVWDEENSDNRYRGPSDNLKALSRKKHRRVCRGGSWNCGPWSCRSACRDGFAPDRVSLAFGIRVVHAPLGSDGSGKGRT